MFACIGIYFGFPVLWSLYYTCSHPTFPFVFYSTRLLLLSDHTMSLPYLISFAVYLLTSACLCSRRDFQCMFMIRIYQYTCAYPCLPFGIHHTTHSGVLTPLVLMSRSWSLEHVDSPSCWSEWRSGSVDLQQPVQSPILSGPPVRLLSFPVMTLSLLCTVHTCTSLCNLAIAHISDVIFM